MHLKQRFTLNSSLHNAGELTALNKEALKNLCLSIRTVITKYVIGMIFTTSLHTQNNKFSFLVKSNLVKPKTSFWYIDPSPLRYQCYLVEYAPPTLKANNRTCVIVKVYINVLPHCQGQQNAYCLPTSPYTKIKVYFLKN